MLEVDKGYFSLNGDSLYIFSGEIHYFRLDQDLVDLHLKRAKEAGLNTVSTYVPWSWHEYQEGKFDFTGKTHPNRNLAGYMKKVKAAGLHLSIRIGPFSNAELKNEGIPIWLTDNYPEVFSKGEGILNLPHTTLISYINPTFRDFVRKWYDRVIPVIEPLQASKGGNILTVQLCNEIGMIQWVNGRGDYSKEATELYQEYLKNKYSNIEELNNVYPGSNFNSFNEIHQTMVRINHGWQDFWDLADFYRHYFSEYYQYLYKIATERGIDSPVIANIPQFIDFDVRGRGFASPMTSSFYSHIPEVVRNIVFGGAYQMRRLDYENFHDVMITTQIVKSLTNYKNPVICAELQTGIMRDKPRLYAPDVELNLKTSMASGVDGVNCYMFSGGFNPDNIGMFGTRHEWQAPVSSKGETDDKFDVLIEHGEFVKTFGALLAETQLSFQTAFGFYPPYYGTEFLSKENCDFLVYSRDRYFFDGLGRLMTLGNIAFKVFNLKRDELDPKEIPSLTVYSVSFMDAKVQQKLADYMEAGGKLMLFPEVPVHELSGAECCILSDKIGMNVCDRIFESPILFGDNECFVEGGVSIVDNTEGAKIIAAINGRPCVVSKDIGKGKFVFLGAPLPHYYDYQIDVVTKLLDEELNVRSIAEISNKDLNCFLRSGDKGSFIFLMNYHDRKYKNISLKIDDPVSKININLDGISLNSRSGKILPVEVKIADDLKIIRSTVEILSVNQGSDSIDLKLKGCKSETAKIVLEYKGKKIEKEILLQEETGSAVIKYE